MKKKTKKMKNKKFNVENNVKYLSFDDLIIYANLIKLLESAFDFCFQKIKYYQN